MGAGIIRRPALEAESEARLMLDQVVRALREQPGVDDWLVRQIRQASTQYYVIGPRPENRRQVHSDRTIVTVMNDHAPSTNGQERVRGQADVTLLPTDLHNLTGKLSQAVFMASVSDNPPYELPGPASYPAVDTAAIEMQTAPRQVAERLVEQLIRALADEKDVRLSSAEVFAEESQIAIENSRGVRGSKVQTELLLDFVLLARGRNDEMESHVAYRRRRATDLDVASLARQRAGYARDAIVAGTPKTGTFPVVVSDDALVELLMSEGYSPLLLRASAQWKFQKLTPWEAGESIFPQTPSGDGPTFTMYSNALLPFGTRSSNFDGDGLPAQRVAIIQNGVLTRFWATNRYAQYLQVPPTGDFGNMEIEGGSVPLAQLLEGGPLYHIVAFSAMGADPLTGDFVGEIRLGYEIDEGRRRPIRGGSISGNLLAALGEARYSTETAFCGDYQGPRAMRFPEVTVAGA
jgi:predicted Zn-dependent protease